MRHTLIGVAPPETETKPGSPGGSECELEAETKRSDLAVQYLPLVKHIVNRMFTHVPQHISREDLYSAGVLGLMEAIQKYQEGQQVSFKTYAYHRIRGAVLDELRSYDIISRSARQKLKSFETAIAALEKELADTPTEEQIADKLGMDIEEYRKQLNQLAPIRVCSFTDLSERDGEVQFVPVDKDVERQADHSGFGPDLQRILVEKLKTIPKIERLIVTLYYYEQMTLKEIAFVLHLSEGRISQLHTQAILRLRHGLRGMAG